MARGRSGIKGAVIGFLYASFAAIVGTLMHQTKVTDEIPIGLLFSLSLVLMLAAGIRDRQKREIARAGFCANHCG